MTNYSFSPELLEKLKPRVVKLLAFYDRYLEMNPEVKLKHLHRGILIVQWWEHHLPSEETLLRWLKEDYWAHTGKAATAIRRQFKHAGIDLGQTRFTGYPFKEDDSYPYSLDTEVTQAQIEWVKRYYKGPPIPELN